MADLVQLKIKVIEHKTVKQLAANPKDTVASFRVAVAEMLGDDPALFTFFKPASDEDLGQWLRDDYPLDFYVFNQTTTGDSKYFEWRRTARAVKVILGQDRLKSFLIDDTLRVGDLISRISNGFGTSIAIAEEVLLEQNENETDLLYPDMTLREQGYGGECLVGLYIKSHNRLEPSPSAVEAQTTDLGLFVRIPYKEGWLMRKRAGPMGTTTWAKQWFVIQKNKLYFYSKSKSDKGTAEPLGCVNAKSISKVKRIDQATDVPSPKGPQAKSCFEVITGNKDYRLLAKSPQDMENWITQLDLARRMFAVDAHSTYAPQRSHSKNDVNRLRSSTSFKSIPQIQKLSVPSGTTTETTTSKSPSGPPKKLEDVGFKVKNGETDNSEEASSKVKFQEPSQMSPNKVQKVSDDSSDIYSNNSNSNSNNSNKASNMVSSLGLANDPNEYVMSPRTAHKYKSLNMKYENILKTSPSSVASPPSMPSIPFQGAPGFTTASGSPSGFSFFPIPPPEIISSANNTSPSSLPSSSPMDTIIILNNNNNSTGTTNTNVNNNNNNKNASGTNSTGTTETKGFMSKKNLSVVIPEPTTKPLLPLPLNLRTPTPTDGSHIVSPQSLFEGITGDLSLNNFFSTTPHSGAFTPTNWPSLHWQSPRQSYISPRIESSGLYDPISLGLGKVSPVLKKPRLGDDKE
eukprot:TRINITY_DN1857_c0_g2_i1.p1 TRINITY_DN1857_c0_g2~~TRINITY_DN1857_c0_g2_i1.p1  ORF type:complete len:685 (-),score=125.11 TRINITY_DN1857_c0_g2_i1:1749-3803(-)